MSTQELTAEEIVTKCRKAGITLYPDNLIWFDEMGWTLDGMPWEEWVEAMYEVRIS